jgi:hypothetical protein
MSPIWHSPMPVAVAASSSTWIMSPASIRAKSPLLSARGFGRACSRRRSVGAYQDRRVDRLPVVTCCGSRCRSRLIPDSLRGPGCAPSVDQRQPARRHPRHAFLAGRLRACVRFRPCSGPALPASLPLSGRRRSRSRCWRPGRARPQGAGGPAAASAARPSAPPGFIVGCRVANAGYRWRRQRTLRATAKRTS